MAPGGFVGVDVFFVISGYVITRSLFGYTGTMPAILKEFYERRIRRLFPAALLVLLYTSVMAWQIIPPDALAEFGRSIVAFTTFWSNWFFASLDGYFDTPSGLKPLLHTWSLSIEEQFYLLFPIPMLLLIRRGIWALTAFFGVIVMISFATSVWLVATGGTEAAFFNSFGRFWEIALGGLLACGVIRNPSPQLARLLGFAGFAMILLAFFLIDEATPFPGFPALLPTLGTAAVILAAQGPVNRALSSRPVKWVGKISYGLYLWHWPIFVTIAYAFPFAATGHYMAGIAATFAAAAASYYLIEEPVRRRKRLPLSRQAFALFLGGVPVLIAAGAVAAYSEGFPHRLYSVYPKSAQEIERDAAKEFITFKGDPKGEKPVIVVIGDSKLRNSSIALNRFFDHDRYDVLSVSYLGCKVEMNGKQLTATTTKPNYKSNCDLLSKNLTEDAIMSRTAAIFLTSHRPFEYKANSFRFDLLRWIKGRSASPVETFVFGDYYQLDGDRLSSCLNLMFQTGSSAKTCIDYASYPKISDVKSLPFYPADLEFTYLDFVEVHCGYRAGECEWSHDGVPFMLDWNHLTVSFLTFLIKDIQGKHTDASSLLRQYTAP